MLKSPDAMQFAASQVTEIESLLKSKVMEVQPITSLPVTGKLLSSIWSYRRKRSPQGTLLKHKARICANGRQQDHVYWETYAPVASWSTIRLMLILSSILGLQSRQVDYTQSFPQAELQDPVFYAFLKAGTWICLDI